MIKKEPYTKDTQPMARDPLHTREQPIPYTGEQPIPNIGKGQGGRSRWRRGALWHPDKIPTKLVESPRPTQAAPLLLLYIDII